ncbi:MAG: Bifunctional protein FolD protein [Planctomycetes bacterium ADurb.Bin126]|nr:MAG: Bifunctional protein FolD protein [Planctomycetes bacterium ADurb.Bin126]HOD83789.1 bifunctional 5,10-methylenetetrahydrofolate dehydrogenase/5,10-methenyltetrahydrofolate cyclohydrolase [Phycisphaerae bacterium]HQL76428.1 bifunctional 5,10-methylenetetrahydrofolate dehydrogenase/5,10-methenyltetrahydrofolate cyclohydrolase [Phycisphaerae bacterium]
MTAKLIDGEAVAAEMNKETAAAADELARAGRRPHLVAVQVGENPASKIYTNAQARSCEAVGIEYELLNLPADISQDDLLEKIRGLNGDPKVHGLILQMPLPAQIDARVVQVTISPDKDVEGMHPQNMGRLFYGGGVVAPCTPMAAVELLRRTCDDLAGKETVVVGHSEIVGKPIAAILLHSLNASPTVTVCHVATRDLAAHTRRADIVFVATGVSQARWLGYNRRKKAGEQVSPPDLSPLIKADMLKEGAIVIDVAINRIPKALDEQGNAVLNEKGKPAMRTVGDVDFEAAKEKVAAITPVPGGVGPVTVAMLLRNTVAVARAS